MSKILIIEDNVDIAELLRDSLSREGFEVVICNDACQGVQFTHKTKPDLILLDLMLPAGGGFSVLENIKLSGYTKTIPVVVLTASKDEEHKKKAIDMGVDEYLEKPYDNNQLISVIRRIIKQ